MDNGSLAQGLPANNIGRLRALLWNVGPIAAAAALPILLFFMQGHIGLSLADEGFLWYGSQRVLAGEIPVRDFQSYDVARYYWASAWMKLAGSDGIVALRLANALLMSLSVALATGMVRKAAPSAPVWFLLGCAMLFTAWMAPDYKVYDSFALLLLTVGATGVLQAAAPTRWAAYGAALGIAAAIGVNHALYGVIATLVLVLYTGGGPKPASSLAALVAGGLVGYAPVLGLALMAPGYAAAFLDALVQIGETGTTNLTRPLPRLLQALQPLGSVVPKAERLQALLLIVTPLTWAAAAFALISPVRRRTAEPVAVAGLILSVPYAHYFISRADDVHLAVSALPLLLAALAWAGQRGTLRQAAALVILAPVTFVLIGSQHTILYTRLHRFEPTTVLGDTVLIRPSTANQLRIIHTLAKHPPSGPLYVAPYLPGAYAVLRQRSPTWENYLLFPATPERQRSAVASLEASGSRKVLLGLGSVDDRQDLGFNKTHGLLAHYVSTCFRPVSLGFPMPSDMIVRVKEDAACTLSAGEGAR